jgi:lipoteichoic acid synthase
LWSLVLRQIDGLETRATERAYVWSVWCPLAALCMVLRAVRVFKRGEVAGVLGALDLMRSDLAIMAALLLGGLGLLVALRGQRRARVLALAALQFVALWWSAFELAATNFFLVSGFCLDLPLVRYALSPETDLWTLMRESTPRVFFVAGGVGAVWLLAVPWVVRWRLMRGEAQGAGRGFPRWVWAVVAGLLGLSWLGPLREPSVPFASNAVVHIARTGLEMAGEPGAQSAKFGTLDARLKAAPGKKAKNVVVIMLESTRASATSIHNPALDTTPFLKSLTKTSIWAEHAYSVVPHTSKAIVSVHCGVEPNLTLSITEASTSGMPAKCIARLLREQGYHTVFFENAPGTFENGRRLAANMGFEDFVDSEGIPSAGFEKANYFGLEDDAMLAPSRSWIEGHRDKPFLLTYLTVTPHHEYLAPRRYGRHEFAEDDMLNRYLNSVHYMDHFVENVINQLKELGVWEDTILVIVGDHGEGFGEHKLYQHDKVAYEEGLRVPLMIHDPSDPREQRISQLANQLDIVPTTLALAGWEVEGGLRGYDLRAIPEGRALLSHCWIERSCIALLDGTIKVIHNFDKSPNEAFDLAKDPEERHNIAGELPDIGERIARMLRWRGEVIGGYTRYYRDHSSEFVLSEMPKDIQNKFEFDIGDYMEFLGYDVSNDGLCEQRSEVTLTFYYRVKRKIPPGWRFSTQGYTSTNKWLNMDHEPMEGLYPMERWEAGSFIKDVYKYKLPATLRPGDTVTVEQGLWREKRGGGVEHATVEGKPAGSNQKVKLFTLEVIRRMPKRRAPAAPR